MRVNPMLVAALSCLHLWQSAGAAGFKVIHTSDSGLGSLRQAILDANALPGANTISFDIPGGGVRKISFSGGLPEITDPVAIDGTRSPVRHQTPELSVTTP